MFASGKAADTGLPPILLGGENDINLDNETYTFSLDTTNSDNIGLNDLVIITIHASSLYYPTITNSDYTTLAEQNTSSATIDDGAFGIYYAVFNNSLDITLQTGGKCLVHYYWFKNVDTSSPIDVTSTLNYIDSTSVSNPYTVDSSSLTTATDNAVVINGVSVQARGSNSDSLSTPSNMITVGDATTGIWSRFSQSYVNLSKVAYATVDSAGSFDPSSFGSWEGISTWNYDIVDYTLALKPANPQQTTTEVTAFNGGESVYVSHSDWAGSTTYDITIDDTTTFSNGKGIGLGDIVIVGITKNGSPYPNVTTSDFTLLYEPASGSGYTFPKIYYAIYNGTDLTISATKTFSVTQIPFVYHYYSIRYPDTSSPIDVSIDVDEINSSSAVDHPSLTTVTDNAIVINGLFGFGVSGSSIVSDLSTPSNMSEAAPEAYGLTWDGSGTQHTSYTTAAQTQKSTAGSFDPASWGTTDSTVFSYTLAIKPA